MDSTCTQIIAKTTSGKLENQGRRQDTCKLEVIKDKWSRISRKFVYVKVPYHMPTN